MLLWKYRGFCFINPESVVKFVWSIPWGHSESVREAYMFLAHWPVLPDPVNALEVFILTICLEIDLDIYGFDSSYPLRLLIMYSSNNCSFPFSC